jgi:molecular chaperone GrpE
VEQLTDRLLRLQADFDNYRKRVLRDKAELAQRANEDLVLDLLPVLDHLELALDAAAAHGADDAIVKGFRLVAEQFIAVLARFGITPIGADGGLFDHNLHEAVSHIPSVEVPESNIIAQVRRGYLQGERLLRAAQVVVSSGCAAPRDEAAAGDAAAENGGTELSGS